jgi:Clp amino terminal domain, pathogenicity island component
MSPTPEIQDLIQSVRAEAAEGDLLAQLAKASEYAGNLNQLGDRLLDHFVQECRAAGISWAELSTALGVSKQAAHKRFTGAGTPPGSAPMFQRFTDRARLVVLEAQEQARSLGHPGIEPEHLLLALFKPEKSIGAHALARLNVTYDQVLEQVLARTPRTDDARVGHIPFGESAKVLLKATLDEALGLGHNYVGTEHLLLAVHHEESEAAARILTGLGADDAAVRAAVTAQLEEYMRVRAQQDPTA